MNKDRGAIFVSVVMFFLGVIGLTGWVFALTLAVRIELLQEAATQPPEPRIPLGSWSQSCDGLEVIVGEEWRTSFAPFSVGMGETFRIEMIAIKEGYDDLQPSAIMCELYPHKRCMWLAERGLAPDDDDPYRTIEMSGVLKGPDGQINGYSFYMDGGSWIATRKGDR